ncbi:MAG TPA: glycosyltransferase family 39 protein [Chloroflexota bacterium]
MTADPVRTKVGPRPPRYLKQLTHEYRDALSLFLAAFALRLLFALVVSNTYDYDEFVILLLGRDYARGAVPYVDFSFFHPPGVLVLYRFLSPFTSLWWPLARIVTSLIDSITTVLVLVVGKRIHGSRGGFAAGLIYAFSPLALVSAVRVGQDPLITFLEVAGLSILLTHSSQRAGLLAGMIAGIAIWIKYPAALVLPVYLAAAPRRTICILGGTCLAVAVSFGPFLWHARALYNDTIVFQRNRWEMPALQRIETAVLYWPAVNVLGLIATAKYRQPPWLLIAFLVGGVFIFSPQIYYHYFVPTVPFGALLSAPLAARLLTVNFKAVVSTLLIVACGWSALLDVGGPSPLFVTAAHLSDINPTVRILDRITQKHDPILADRFEYAYLAKRPAALHYFWNVGVLVGPRYLERRLAGTAVVVLSSGASSGYPPGFTSFLQRRYPAVRIDSTTLWLTRRTVSN